MTRYVFDCETNGFLNVLTTLHSLVLIDADTEEVFSCHNHYAAMYPIQHGLDLLSTASEIIGHNIIEFDIPAIQKVYPQWRTKAQVTDTLVCVRLIFSDVKDMDFKFRAKNPTFPAQLIGRHSLKAWGYRLKEFKGDFGETTDWDTWTPEMQDYCIQDVRVNLKLFKNIEARKYAPQSLKLEHDVCHILNRQMMHGFKFDIKKATDLYVILAARREVIGQKLRDEFGGWYVQEEVKLAAHTRCVFKAHPAGHLVVRKTKVGSAPYRRKDGEWAITEKPIYEYPLVNGWMAETACASEYTNIKRVEFNPESRDHIAKVLSDRYGWKPKLFGKDGKPTIDEDILKVLLFPVVASVREYLMVCKRIAQLAEGKQAWLKLVSEEGSIHGRVNGNGAITGRMTHHSPNVAQAPSVVNQKGPVPYGKECRELFTVKKGYKLIGCDASGLELRMLAHFLAHWDKGAYAKEVLEGDIHTVNQKAAGLSTRAQAKTFIYAFLYGAGDEKIGSIALPSGTADEQRKLGKKLKARFLKKIPALGHLVKTVASRTKTVGHLKGLDGRILAIRSSHAALNVLLQSAGALVMKQSLVILDNNLQDAGLVAGIDYEFVANVHDEFQIEVKEKYAEVIGKLAQQSIAEAGQHFKMKCRLDADYKIGNNWAETH